MPPAELTILGSTAAGEQKQRHLDPEGLLKPTHHIAAGTEATRHNRAAQTLPRLGAEHCEQSVEAMLEQRLSGCHAADQFKAEIQTILRNPQRWNHRAQCTGLCEMLRDIAKPNRHDLDRSVLDRSVLDRSAAALTEPTGRIRTSGTCKG